MFVPGRKVQEEEQATNWMKSPENSSVEREKFLSELAREESRKRSEARRLEREQRKAKLEERNRRHREKTKEKQKVRDVPIAVTSPLFFIIFFSLYRIRRRRSSGRRVVS